MFPQQCAAAYELDKSLLDGCFLKEYCMQKQVPQLEQCGTCFAFRCFCSGFMPDLYGMSLGAGEGCSSFHKVKPNIIKAPRIWLPVMVS